MIFKTKFPITCLGSLPDSDEKNACKDIFSKFKEIPYWPQLPKKSFLENMYAQFSENLPGLVINEAKKTIFVNTKGIENSIGKIFKEYLDFNIDYFKISKNYASGFYEFLAQGAVSKKNDWQFIKGHITGPISFGLTLRDENKKALFYNKEYKELLVKFLSMKAIWQIRKLKGIFKDVIIFIDEPYLVSVGSSFINIKEEDVVADLNEVADCIHKEGAFAGVHCCGNTNWGLLLKTKLDIINFDAYTFIKSITLYPEELKNFLDRSGIIAFGLVPSQIELAGDISAQDLIDLFKGGLKELSKKGISQEAVLKASLITPSCGLGNQDKDSAGKIIDLLIDTRSALKKLFS